MVCVCNKICLAQVFHDVYNEVHRYAFFPAYIDVYNIRKSEKYQQTLAQASKNQLKQNLENQIERAWSHNLLRRKNQKE